MTRLPLLIALAALVLLPASAAAKAPVCDPDNIQQALIAAGKLTEQDVHFGEKVDLVRCGEVTADDTIDAVFTVFSGGTAGDTHFGVLRGNADGSPGALALYRSGYKVGIARHNRRSFDVIQPHYAGNDPNCCPSSFRVRRFSWTGSHFKSGKAKKLRTAPRRFYRRS